MMGLEVQAKLPVTRILKYVAAKRHCPAKLLMCLAMAQTPFLKNTHVKTILNILNIQLFKKVNSKEKLPCHIAATIIKKHSAATSHNQGT